MTRLGEWCVEAQVDAVDRAAKVTFVVPAGSYTYAKSAQLDAWVGLYDWLRVDLGVLCAWPVRDLATRVVKERPGSLHR